MKPNNKAFSLIEVLISIAILSTSLIVVLKAFSFSAKATGISLDFTKAVFLAEDKIQELEFSLKNNLIGKDTAKNKGKEGKFEWKYVITSKPEFNLFTLDFEVAWKRFNEARSLSLNSYLR